METKIFKKIKKHWLAISIAMILGALITLPFFYFQISLGDEYKGILKQIIDDELFYMARIKDAMGGHPTLGNAYLWEHKNQLPQQLFLPEFLLAQPLKYLNLDVVQGRVFYSFFLPVIAFILTYVAFYFIYPSKSWANLFAVFLFFGIFLFKFARPVIPQFVFIFWLSQFIFLWLLIRGPDNKEFIFLNILNFGLLFYVYPFYWTFYLVFLAILAFIFFFKDPEGAASRTYGAGRLLSKQVLKILIGGLVIGSVYFYLTFLASQLPEYQETLTRLQLVFSRSPSEVKSASLSLAVLFLMGVLYCLKIIKINRENLFFTGGVISILLVTNQNIITGQKFEFGHYRMLAIFFLVFVLYYLFGRFKKKLLKFTPIILIIMVLFVFNGISGFTNKTLKISEQDIYAQNYKSVFNWLNENTLSDSVVYANEEISGLIPAYTKNNVFYARNANLFIISDEEVKERFILNNFFEKFDRDFVVENERAIWGVRYVNRYGDAVQANKWRRLLGFGLKDEVRLPENEIEMILTKVGQIQSGSFEKNVKKYRVDYFIWDKNKNPEWQLNNQKFLEGIFEDRDFVIYRVL